MARPLTEPLLEGVGAIGECSGVADAAPTASAEPRIIVTGEEVSIAEA